MMRTTLSSLLVAAAFAPAVPAQFFTPGNVVLLRVGDPSLTLGSTAAPVFLEEWNTSTNSLVQVVGLPNVNGAGLVPAPIAPNTSFAQRGFSSSEGQLNLSADGRYLVVGGYDRAIGATDPTAEPAATTPRVIARIDVLTGDVDTSTALTDAYDGAPIRGATSDDGTRFWTSGNSTAGAVRFAANVGATTSLTINGGAPTNCRFIGIYDFDLYVTSASTGALAQGILQVGTGGLPTTGSQPMTLLPGFPTNGTFTDGAPYDFFFANDTTVYVADEQLNSLVGGIQKWEFNGTTWVRTAVFQVQTGYGARGLTGLVRNGQVELWVTAETSGFITSLWKVVDNGTSFSATLVSTEPTNQVDYRGVRVIGSPFVNQGGGCATAKLQVSGSGLVGTTVKSEVANPQGFPFLNYSVNPLGLPFTTCGCVLNYDIGVLAGQAVGLLTIPNNPTLIGATFYNQGLDLFDPTTTCVDPILGLPVSLTDGVAVTIR